MWQLHRGFESPTLRSYAESRGDYIFLIVVLDIHRIKKELLFILQVSGFKEMAQKQELFKFIYFQQS